MQTLAVFLLGMALALGGRVAAQTPGNFAPGTCCPLGATGPCCVGQWTGPVDLDISCPGPFQQPAGSNCAGAGGPDTYWDEIAHAVLLPWGAAWHEDPNDTSSPLVQLGGKVLVWTSWDDDTARGGHPYMTYVFDPNNLGTSVILEAPILMNTGGPLPDDSGIFCSGHTWRLDENQKPELLVVGGALHDNPNPPHPLGPIALDKAFTFDPNAATADDAWSDDPTDLPVPNWYPSVITYGVGNPVTSFRPIALGGSGIRPDKFGCGVVTLNQVDYAYQYDRWWTLPTSTGAWSVEGGSSTYYWQQYPRSLFLSNRTVLSIGNAIICEAGLGLTAMVNSRAFAQYGTPDGEFGGNPINEIVVAGMTRTDPAPAAPYGVNGWLYTNVVLMHTLKDRSLYQTNLNNYDLDRIIVYGGAQDSVEDQDPPMGTTNGMKSVWEWNHGQWKPKIAASNARLFGSFVALPDGSILAMGGRTEANEPKYVNDVARFWPDLPTTYGTWETMRARPIVGTSPSFGDYATPRGYHSAGLLLQDGRVALMGGRHESDDLEFPAANSIHSVEIFAPPYTFDSNRLKITGGIAPLKYGTEVGFNVNDHERVVYACLIGLGSVTHHFDYNGRYVELMTSTTSVPSGKDVKVWVPGAELLPEGPYLLFVVEERSVPGVPLVRVPSVLGRFVTVTF